MDVPIAMRGGQDGCWLHGSGAGKKAAGAAHKERGVRANAVYIKLAPCLLAVRQAFVSADSPSLSRASN